MVQALGLSWVCENLVPRARATSSSTAVATPEDCLPAEHLQAEAAARGSDWLWAELGSMTLTRTCFCGVPQGPAA